MEDSVIAGILLGAVAIFIVIITLLYIVISYILWRRKSEADRQNHCLNRLFKGSPSKRKLKNDNHREGKTQDFTVSYENKSCVILEQSDVIINTESIKLDVPQSPIRKSAGTYSIVDLNDDG